MKITYNEFYNRYKNTHISRKDFIELWTSKLTKNLDYIMAEIEEIANWWNLGVFKFLL